MPAPLPPSKLDGDLRIIDNFLLDPVDPQNGKSASELLRKQRKKPVRRKRRAPSDAGSGGEVEFDEDGEPIVTEKKKKQRQKKREEEEAAYKSAQFVRSRALLVLIPEGTEHLHSRRSTTRTTRTTRSGTQHSLPLKLT